MLTPRFRPGVDTDQAMAALSRRVEGVGSFAALPADRPVDLVNFGRVQNLPVVLASILAALAALAALTLAHLLVTSTRRRRRDVAVLRTLGFVPRQVHGAVATQATTLATLALVLGVPLGVLAARLLWLAFAHGLGIVPRPVLPVAALLILVPATVVAANAIAYLPGRRAARGPVAQALRVE